MSISSLDDTDRELIGLLRDNARLSIVTLAKKLRVARATVQNRIAKLERDGVIVGYTVRLRPNVDTQRIRAITCIAVEGNRATEIRRRLTGHPNVVALHTTNGRWDLVAELRTDTLEAFDTVLNEPAAHRRHRQYRDKHPAVDLQAVGLPARRRTTRVRRSAHMTNHQFHLAICHFSDRFVSIRSVFVSVIRPQTLPAMHGAFRFSQAISTWSSRISPARHTCQRRPQPLEKRIHETRHQTVRRAGPARQHRIAGPGPFL